MVTSPTTFETDLRRKLLDVIYGQWLSLGVAVSASPSAEAPEVIDPEALLWVSMEFLPTEPRLAEAVLLWLHGHWNDIIRQRLKHRLGTEEPRACIWRTIEQAKLPGNDIQSQPVLPDEPCYGLDSPEQVVQFCETLAQHIHTLPSSLLNRVGEPAGGPSTTLLRARDIFGSDGRHFLLLYLLGNSRGAPRAIQEWTGYSLRTITDTVARWEKARVVSVEHGVCRLLAPDAWDAILQQPSRRLILVDWFKAFDACIRLLRTLAKATRASLPPASPVITACHRETRDALSASLLNKPRAEATSLSKLQSLFSEGDEREDFTPSYARPPAR